MERYKELLLKRCPHHELPNWLQLQTFYNGLMNDTRMLVDATTRGSLMGKSIKVAMELLKEMVTYAYYCTFECNTLKETFVIYELDVLTTLSS